MTYFLQDGHVDGDPIIQQFLFTSLHIVMIKWLNKINVDYIHSIFFKQL